MTRILRQIVELVVMVAIAFALAWFIRTFIVQPYVIPSGSMIPAIEIGDHVLADKYTFRFFRDPRPGDIVVLSDPTGENPNLIKRLIATEGQTVDFRSGTLYIDGVEQAEPYVYGKPSEVVPGTEGTYPYTIPEGMAWVMGDNRPNSGDSRVFGPVPVDSIVARGFFTYWPWDRIAPLR